LAIAAQNARCHGLAVPVSSDRVLSAEVEELAKQIAPDGSSPILLDHARRIAAAQVDIMRVRRARTDLIARAFFDAPFDLAPKIAELIRDLGLRIAQRRSAQNMDLRELFSLAHDQLNSLPWEDLLWSKLGLGEELAALERYERRAFSRRKSAIRAFDAAYVTEAADRPQGPKGRRRD
jgi:hypothetical protein